MSVSPLVAAFVAFAATTVDDLIIVTALFTTGRVTGQPRAEIIVAGQYAGVRRDRRHLIGRCDRSTGSPGPVGRAV
ncbi:hypothetical protein [Nocardia vaccinii]|uniref:hypothetical protein n=1 Tax=Nocardia vaccinii TaxID=1822 RepID=UPI0008353A8A|nr:hypothetical protein [Nocardia vaccinii]